jgi:hypothetical protein
VPGDFPHAQAIGVPVDSTLQLARNHDLRVEELREILSSPRTSSQSRQPVVAVSPDSAVLSVALGLRSGSDMTTPASKSTTLLRWVFQRGHYAITCSIDMIDDGAAFDVFVLPHWNLSASTIKRFDDAASAFAQHAELAMMLRQAGWAVAWNSPRHQIAAA